MATPLVGLSAASNGVAIRAPAGNFREAATVSIVRQSLQVLADQQRHPSGDVQIELKQMSELVNFSTLRAGELEFALFRKHKALPSPQEPVTSSLPMEAQKKIFHGTIAKTWQSMAELYGNFSLEELGFLTLDQFVQLGLTSIITLSHPDGRKCRNIEMLTINWKMKGQFKILAEAFQSLWTKHKISTERQKQLQKYLDIMERFVNLPQCYGEKLNPGAVPNAHVYQFLCRQFYDLCALFSPIFSEANSNLVNCIHTLEKLCFLLDNALIHKTGRSNIIKNEITVYRITLQWLYELQFYTRSIPLRLRHTDLDPCDAMLSQDIAAIRRCKEEVEKELLQFQQWNSIFSSGIPKKQTEEVCFEYFQSHMQLEAVFFDHLSKFLLEQMDALARLPVVNLTPAIRKAKAEKLFLDLYLNIPRLFFNSLSIKFTEDFRDVRCDFHKLSKKENDLIHKIKENQPQVFCTFIDSYITACQTALKQTVQFIFNARVKFDNLCSYGGPHTQTFEAIRDDVSDILRKLINPHPELIKPATAWPELPLENIVVITIRGYFSNLAAMATENSNSQEHYDAFWKGRGEKSKNFFTADLGEAASHAISIDKIADEETVSTAAERLQPFVNVALFLHDTSLNVIKTCQQLLPASPAVTGEIDDSWMLDVLDQTEDWTKPDLQQEVKEKASKAKSKRKHPKPHSGPGPGPAAAPQAAVKAAAPTEPPKENILALTDVRTSFISELRTVHGVAKAVVLPSDMQQQEFDPMRLHQLEQVSALCRFHGVNLMLDRTTDVRGRQFLARNLTTHGYLSIEHALSQHAQRASHQLSDMLHPDDPRRRTHWVVLLDRGSYMNRYPAFYRFSAAQEASVLQAVLRDRKLWEHQVYQMHIESSAGFTRLRELAEKMQKMESAIPSKKAMSAESTSALQALIHSTTTLDTIRGAVEELAKGVAATPIYHRHIGKRLQCIEQHLRLLTELPHALKENFQPEFWGHFATEALLRTHYVLENLGTLRGLCLENRNIMTHHLETFRTRFRLGARLNSEHNQQQQSIKEIKKGTECAYFYFASLPRKADPAPAMVLLSQLEEVSQRVLFYGPDLSFIPPGRKPIHLEVLERQFWNHMRDLFGLVEAIVQQDLLQDGELGLPRPLAAAVN